MSAASEGHRTTGRGRWGYRTVAALGLVVGMVCLAVPLASVAGAATTPAVSPSKAQPSPIKHVVIILQENHSFDNVLGKFCAEVADHKVKRGGSDDQCDGATSGPLSTGQVVQLESAPNFVPTADHSVAGQQVDIDNGKMDGFNLTSGCTGTMYPDCYNQYDPLSGPCKSATGSCITNVASLASRYVVSDHTFELAATPSWAGHLVFATASTDGFVGTIPTPPGTGTPQPVTHGPGWGCDSGDSTEWGPSQILVPSCVPDSTGSLGPNWLGYTGPKAPYVETIFDEFDAKGLPWRIYGGLGAPLPKVGFAGDGWTWAICPSFAECLYSQQRGDLVPATNVLTDAAAGNLPAFSIITPLVANSQHNDDLMSTGDNWIGTVMTSLMDSPEWSSTAVFLTWDDCGCFYDHVSPLPYSSTWGLRVPMIIVSPYAKPGYTDRTPTTFAGILAFAEKTFGLPALNTADGTAYDYSGSFCYNPATAGCSNVGTSPTPMVTTPAPALTPAQLKLSIESGKDDT
jgi:phospholipase C